MSATEGFATMNVDVGEVSLHARIGGHGHPVVLLHGFPQHGLAWRHVANMLQDETLICPDLRGYGSSDRPPGGPEAYSKRAMATDIIGLLDALGEPTCSLIGHDRGALVAFRAALDIPSASTASAFSA